MDSASEDSVARLTALPTEVIAVVIRHASLAELVARPDGTVVLPRAAAVCTAFRCAVLQQNEFALRCVNLRRTARAPRCASYPAPPR